MTSATVVTGRHGEFVVGNARVARTKQWQVNPKLATKSEWGDSDSGGYTNRAPGRFDATFTAEGVYDTSIEAYDLFMPGDILLAVLWMDSTSLYWYFPRALCEDFNLMVNIDSEEVEGWTSAWGADGIFYKPGGAGAPSANLP
jgi:hypothetical protein